MISEEEIRQFLATSQAYADTQLEVLEKSIETVESALEEIKAERVGLAYSSLSFGGASEFTITAQDLQYDVVNPSFSPENPDAQDFDVPNAPDTGGKPALTARLRGLITHAPPVAHTFTGFPSTPTLTPFRSVTKPNFDKPNLPEIVPPELPDKPTLPDLPVLPDPPELLDMQPPEPVLNFSEEEYRSELKNYAETWLTNIIRNGGTGLHPDVEQDIWNRGIAREVNAARRNLESAIDEFAASGFPAPPGALRARTDALRNELQDRSDDLSRKIAEDQANLAQKNTHFALDKSLVFVTMEMEHHHRVAERALRAANIVVEMAVNIYNLKVTEFQSRLELFKTGASIYEIQIRARTEILRQYSIEMEGAKLQNDVNRATVDVYSAQMNALKIEADLYRTELDASIAEFSINDLLLQRFRTLIEVERLKLDSKRSEFELFKAKIDGEESKIREYEAEVRAYEAEAKAYETNLRVEKTRIDVEMEIQRMKLEEFKQRMEVYKSNVDGFKLETGQALQAFEIKNRTWLADLSRAEAELRTKVIGEQLRYQQALDNNTFRNEAYKLDAQLALEATQFAVTGSAGVLQARSNVAAAALAQINAIAAGINDGSGE